MKKHIISLMVLFILLSTTVVGFSHRIPVPSNNTELTFNNGLGCASPYLDDIPGIQWSRLYGTKGADDFYKVRKTTDGGYIIVGWTKSYGPDGLMAAWLVKTDGMGFEEWNHTYGSFAVFGTDCQQTSDGGYVFCGVNNQSCMWLVKTDALGIQQWEQSYEDLTAWCCTQTIEGGYILSGHPGIFIRTDSQGNVLWKRAYLDPSHNLVNQISQTEDGGFIAVGKTYYYSHSLPNGFLIKLDENGTEEWNHTYFKSESSVLFSYAKTPDNGYLAAGAINQSPWVVRTDQNGNELWNKTYTDISGIADDVVSLDVGGYALVGPYLDDGFLLTIDENGTKLWDILFNSYLCSLQQASDGSIVTAGNDESVDMRDGFLMKIGHIPHVTITKPTDAFYLFDKEKRPLRFPFIIGPITIEADAYDTEYSINRVEFLVDGILKNTVTTAPYSWRWTTPSFFTHTLTVTAYNDVENCTSQALKVWKIF
jgi:hypothetical protein